MEEISRMWEVGPRSSGRLVVNVGRPASKKGPGVEVCGYV
jgi:hypothetical protein